MNLEDLRGLRFGKDKKPSWVLAGLVFACYMAAMMGRPERLGGTTELDSFLRAALTWICLGLLFGLCLKLGLDWYEKRYGITESSRESLEIDEFSPGEMVKESPGQGPVEELDLD